MAITLFVLLGSIMLAFNLPAFYESAKLGVRESYEALDDIPERTPVRPILAALLLAGGVLPVWFLTHNTGYALFILFLAIAAYIDCITRWVPDVVIFSLSWIALSNVMPGTHDLIPIIAAGAIMLAPALLLNLAAFLKGHKAALATGDLYLLPALGIWLTPESAALCMALSILIAVAGGHFIKSLPFVAVLYPVFTVVSLCVIY